MAAATTGTTGSARTSGGSTRKPTSTANASGRPTRRLVIVESPSKAKKIQPYLGNDYVVESSVGHIRDLPRGAADVPAKYKGESWARLGVDVDNQFSPLYIVTPEKRSTVSELREALKTVDELLLATDPDREGEAIAWHLLETLQPKVPVRRMVFHEITESAIRAAAENTRELDQHLVDTGLLGLDDGFIKHLEILEILHRFPETFGPQTRDNRFAFSAYPLRLGVDGRVVVAPSAV